MTLSQNLFIMSPPPYHPGQIFQLLSLTESTKLTTKLTTKLMTKLMTNSLVARLTLLLSMF